MAGYGLLATGSRLRSLEWIDADLHISSRTLQRRLRDAGTSFRSELNLIRHESALSYLRDELLQIADIAMLLGYSEHSAFTRAFKEWCGRTPAETRRESLSTTYPVKEVAWAVYE
jgi:AraC-like DNA-binding protein